MIEKLIVVNPRGFCAGVEMAIKALSWMIKLFPNPIYCYHEIVHNDWIVEVFKKSGVIFVDSPDEIPDNSIAMLSAHGTSPDVQSIFYNKSSILIDSVCPLVTKVHHEAKIFADKNTSIIYVGHKDHDESSGALGVAPENMTLIEKPTDLESFHPINKRNVALLAQTTLAMSEWNDVLLKAKEKYPELVTPRKSDLCYATTNRQKAVLQVLDKVDSVIVVGSSSSSNTNALVRTVQSKKKHAYRVNNIIDLNKINEIGKAVAITAGASAPDHIVQEIIENLNPNEVELFTLNEEEEYFPLPRELRSIYNKTNMVLDAFFPLSKNTLPKNSISNDKLSTATQALEEL